MFKILDLAGIDSGSNWMRAVKASIAIVCPGFTLLGCAYCNTCGTGPTNSGPAYSASGTTSSDSNASERSTVIRGKDGSTTYIFTKPSETTVVGRDGVTVIQRDPDGTRTVVRPGGKVRVIPGHPR